MRIYAFKCVKGRMEVPAETLAEATACLPYHWKQPDEDMSLTVTIRAFSDVTEYYKARCQMLETQLHEVLHETHPDRNMATSRQ